MSNTDKEKLNNEGTKYLSASEASALLFESFEYSQGDEDLQFDIYEYLHERFPELRIDEATLIEANQLALKRISSFVLPKEGSEVRMHVDDLDQDILNIGVPRQMKNLKNALDGFKTYEEISGEVHLQKILERIISRDSWFFYGRPRSANANRRDGKEYDPGNSPKTDPHASHICDYIIRGVEVKIPEYKQMFLDLRTQLVQSLQENTMSEEKRDKLNEIIAKYDTEHEGRDVAGLLQQLIAKN